MQSDKTKISGLRAAVRAAACALALLVAVSARAEPIKGEVQVFTDGGYARLIFKFQEEVQADARIAGAVLVVTFRKPVAIAVDRLNTAREYISAARLDPDGGAIRIALAQKVRLSTIPAAERYFVDLLPAKWTGLEPGLPQEVIDELARRLREAERQLHQQKLRARQRTETTIRVKVGAQPTFIRYIFEVPELANVVPERTEDKLVLNFDQPIKFDLADVKATLPATLESVDSDYEHDSATVTFMFKGMPTVRSFREERNLIIDVGTAASAATPSDGGMFAASQKASDGKPAGKPAGPAITAPETIPAHAKAGSKKEPEPVPAAKQGAAKEPAKIEPKAAPKAEVKVEPKAEPKVEPKPAARAEAKPEPKPESKPHASAAPNEAPAADAPAPPRAEKIEAKEAKAEPKAPPVPKAAEQNPAAAESPARPAAQPPEKAAAAPPRSPVKADGTVVVDLRKEGENLRLEFPFGTPTPAAVFRRANMLWLVFDSAAKIDVGAIVSDDNKLIRSTVVDHGIDGETIVRLKLERPRLTSLSAEGPTWVLNIGDTVTEPTRPLVIARNIVGKNRSSITIPFAEPRAQHKIADPDVGDTLIVVTALAPARGFLKPQEFVELHALSSTQGVVVQPLADDISAELSADKIVIGRPGGLSVSTASIAERDQPTNFHPVMFDTQTWGFDRESKFSERQSDLMGRAAAAPEGKRRTARLDLARFYLAREMAEEAKGVLDVVTADERDGSDVTGTVLKAVANILLDRPDDALKDLSLPSVGNQGDAPIWRAVAHARQGKWPQARDEFKAVETSTGALPIELQRLVMRARLRASIEVRDFSGASELLKEFDTLGVPADMKASVATLVGRLEEGLGHNQEAINAYRAAAAADDRKAAAQGKLRELTLRFSIRDLSRKDMIDQLETLTTTWRGDETEVEGLKILAHLYTLEKRPRDAFHVMRTALLAHPNSDLTRKIQDEAAATFDSLFLTDAGDAMPPVEALGLFYDYKELTPIGRRGDEMIRRLTDRLVAVDLLDQASELLQHQVDHRLQGAARAQVATKLATIYLMNHKAAKALSTLQATRVSDLSGELRDQRLLLEARALSDLGRHDFALEIIASMKGRHAERLRADILWGAKKWREAAEQIELLYGERWKEFAPLSADERSDVMRAAIGYSLADEPLSLARFRDKYAAKMAEGPDRHAFEVVTAPLSAGGSEFRDIAGGVAGTNTLDAFLREMRAHYPDEETPVAGGEAAKPSQDKAAATSESKAGQKAEAKPAEKAAAPATPVPPAKPAGAGKPDPAPTGSITRRPSRASLGPQPIP